MYGLAGGGGVRKSVEKRVSLASVAKRHDTRRFLVNGGKEAGRKIFS